MGRWLLFFLTILIGTTAGLIYGWKINPIEFSNTTLERLKEDYRADYILMVAEIFHSEADLDQATNRLATLSGDPPLDLVRQALFIADKAGYSDQDMLKLRTLLTAYESQAGRRGTSTP